MSAGAAMLRGGSQLHGVPTKPLGGSCRLHKSLRSATTEDGVMLQEPQECMNETEAFNRGVNIKLWATLAIKRKHVEEKAAWKFHSNNVTVGDYL